MPGAFLYCIVVALMHLYCLIIVFVYNLKQNAQLIVCLFYKNTLFNTTEIILASVPWTPSDRIGKAVVSYAEGCGFDLRQRLHRLKEVLRRHGYVMDVGNCQPIRSTVYDAIDRIWMWSTAFRMSPIALQQ